MGNYVGNDALNTFTLATTGISDVAWSNDETRIFAATTDGKIKVFDIATHALLNTWSVGQSLAAVSLSDDGKTLVASGVTASGASVVFAIDTTSGTKSVFKPAVPGATDVEIVDNQHVLVAGNGTERLLELDLATGTFTQMVLPNGASARYTILTEDTHLTLIADRDSVNGCLAIYDDRTGSIVNSALLGNEYNSFIIDHIYQVSISEKANIVFQFSPDRFSHLSSYDTSLEWKGLGYASGDIEAISFDGTGDYCYFYYAGTPADGGKIVRYRLGGDSGFQPIASLPMPSAETWDTNFGNALHVSKSGYQMSVLTGAYGSGLTLIDLTTRNDVFKGTAGADTFAGGLGDDTYTVNSPGDVITELAMGGIDTAVTALSYTLADNVEGLRLVGSGAIDGFGNALDNTITGNAGINTLDGGAGSDRLVGVGGGDTLRGGLGNDTLESSKGIDTLIGGAGNDTYLVNDPGDIVSEASATDGIDTVRTSVSYHLTDWTENLVLTGSARTGTGNDLGNTITGTDSANTLDGGSGNDVLQGLGGKDTLIGGAGNDVLDGGAGADTMIGGTGDDTYYVDSTRYDRIIEDAVGGGTDTLIASVNIARLDANVENLVLAAGAFEGTGNDLINTITGNAQNNRIEGGAGDDHLSGGAGDDRVDGGAGADMLSGGEGNDTLFGGTGADQMNGGAGADTMIGGAGDDTYYVDNALGDRIMEDAVGGGIDTVIAGISISKLADNVENLDLSGVYKGKGTGNDLANTITGNDWDNTIKGGGGDDHLIGSGGNDTLYGGTGADQMAGDEGKDMLLGGAGADVMTGGRGNDTLDGGAGADQMAGGAGDDIYYVDTLDDQITELAREGTDTVYSKITWSLAMTPRIENIALNGSGNIDATGNAAANHLAGGSGNNRLSGLGGNDILDGQGGIDTYSGGNGADQFVINAPPAKTPDAMTTITDFSSNEHDLIDLTVLDQGLPNGGTQVFIGTAAFSGAMGEVRFEQKDGDTYVTGNLSGDITADFTIKLAGLHILAAADFLL